MPDDDYTAGNPHSSTAYHANTGEKRQAYELWRLGYDDGDRWLCVGDGCRVEVLPCCWEWSESLEKFLTKSGQPAILPPFFRAKNKKGHVPGCNATLLTGPRFQHAPEYHLRVAGIYPAWIKLRRQVSLEGQISRGQEDEIQAAERFGQRARPTYGIQEACVFYADHPDQRQLPLRLQNSPGLTYDDVFTRLGTGAKKLGKNWIFFDQLWFSDFIDLRAGTKTFELPLLTTIKGKPRQLVVHTSKWPFELREAFRKKLLAALSEAKAALSRGRPDRPWIFFYGQEMERDQNNFQIDLQTGVDVLVRNLPDSWTFQVGNRFRRGKQWRPDSSGPYAPPPDGVAHPPAKGSSEHHLLTDPAPSINEDSVSTDRESCSGSLPGEATSIALEPEPSNSDPAEKSPTSDETAALPRHGQGDDAVEALLSARTLEPEPTHLVGEGIQTVDPEQISPEIEGSAAEPPSDAQAPEPETEPYQLGREPLDYVAANVEQTRHDHLEEDANDDRVTDPISPSASEASGILRIIRKALSVVGF